MKLNVMHSFPTRPRARVCFILFILKINLLGWLVGWLVCLDAIQQCHLQNTSFLNRALECLHLVLDHFDRTLLIAVWSRGTVAL
jgi:hypothetical protein